MTEEKTKLSLVEEPSETPRREQLLYVGEVTKYTKEVVINIVAQKLLADWFPTRVPVDIEQWREIAVKDASCIVEELIAHNVLKLEE